MRVLDGNHRINRWVEWSDARDHDVHIHTVVGPVQFRATRFWTLNT
jgi:hypothetical protein